MFQDGFDDGPDLLAEDNAKVNSDESACLCHRISLLMNWGRWQPSTSQQWTNIRAENITSFDLCAHYVQLVASVTRSNQKCICFYIPNPLYFVIQASLFTPRPVASQLKLQAGSGRDPYCHLPVCQQSALVIHNYPSDMKCYTMLDWNENFVGSKFGPDTGQLI